jgi:hypothetical protein
VPACLPKNVDEALGNALGKLRQTVVNDTIAVSIDCQSVAVLAKGRNRQQLRLSFPALSSERRWPTDNGSEASRLRTTMAVTLSFPARLVASLAKPWRVDFHHCSVPLLESPESSSSPLRLVSVATAGTDLRTSTAAHALAALPVVLRDKRFIAGLLCKWATALRWLVRNQDI